MRLHTGGDVNLGREGQKGRRAFLADKAEPQGPCHV